MEEELNNIELRSEEVQEIMGHIPAKIIRYGITVIFSVILVIFFGSFFFKYPDILTSPIEVVTENPPASIVAKANGNLSFVFVQDSQIVEQNAVLGVIKNSANYSDALLLKKFVSNEDIIPSDSIFLMSFPDSLQLGDIQNSYTSFLKLKRDFFQFRSLDYYPKKIASLKRKSIELEKYAQLMQNQANLKKKDYALTENQFNRDSTLFKKDVISLSEYETARRNLLQNGLSYENSKSSVVNTNIQLQELYQQIIDLEIDYSREFEGYQNSLNESFQNLKSRMAWWSDSYLLVSPINGVVAFNKIWSNNQFVQAGNEVFTIVPIESSQIIGRITLAAQGAGKLKRDQQVNIKFNNYPHQEFGMITTVVSNISIMPSDENYIVEVLLPDTLITNYGFLLPFSQKMKGTAEIITEDLPLIFRLFNPLKSILKKHLAEPSVRKVSDERRRKSRKWKASKQKEHLDSLPTNSVSDIEELKNDNSQKLDNEKPNKTYHIIAGSYIDLEKANKSMEEYTNRGYQVELLNSDNRRRLSIYKTKDKSLVFKELDKIKAKEMNEAIWVFIEK